MSKIAVGSTHRTTGRLGRRHDLRAAGRRHQRDHGGPSPNQDRIRFVLVHHEEAAAFMATGYAKSTGRLGVCLATSGPGAIHLLNGLYDAKLDHVPVLAITGMQETQMLGTGYQQEVALEKLFMDVAEYNEMIHVPAQCRPSSTSPIRHALTRRGVAHLTIPTDIQIADAGRQPVERPGPGGRSSRRRPSTCPPRACPDTRTSLAAADVLNAGTKVVMLVGAGALGARDEVLRDGRTSGQPDRQDAARQGGRPR